ncbi:nucleoredoxin isoform X13 [Hypanus sabinus]|uniref:nucleoredoxin isoform X13 n=1 Tax=Hypanus sabinus TaxID=79690 RepID=UPI0028C3F74D|nr:nucleoredoxin isoform X13 [Hypanus sabinus]
MAGPVCELLGERLTDRHQAEVECSPLGSDGRLLALYFGCSWSAPCQQFTAALADFYGRFKQGENADRLEVVFIGSEEKYQPWQEFVGQMPWLVLPFQEKEKKVKLWSKYKVTNIPTLIFIEGSTGRIVSRNGQLIIRDDPMGSEFPWGPKSFGEVMAGPLIKNSGQVVNSSELDGSYVGIYFSAHWCPPCKGLTRVLVETYRKIKESGQKFEIVFVSADRSEDSYKQYFSEMPWTAVPYTDETRRSRLNRHFDIQDSEEEELEPAKQLIQPIAEKILSEHKAKEEDAPLLFFVAGEDDMTESLRDFTNLPESAPLLTILDMSQRAKYVKDVEEITPAIVEEFVRSFLMEKLKPEPI